LDAEGRSGVLVIFKPDGIRKKFEVRNGSGEKTHCIEIQRTDLGAFPGNSTPSWLETKYSVERCRTDDARLCIKLRYSSEYVASYLPMVCVPTATGTWKSATAAPDPEDEPPGVRVGSWGFLVLVPMVIDANSVVVVFPGNGVKTPRYQPMLRRTEYQRTGTPQQHD
jgi:hypothetical protein